LSSTRTVTKDVQNEPRGRKEDIRLITGKGRYVDDINLENQAYLGIVRSPYAHAWIKKIDFSRVRSNAEFISSLTGEDLLKEGLRPISQFPITRQATRYHLAVGKVRYVGEAVAAVLVRTLYSVEDAIDEVDVEYEELPVVRTIEESKRGNVLLYEDWGNNVGFNYEVKKGDAEKAIQSAAYVVKTKAGIVRQAGAAIEPRSVIVSFDKGKGVYEIYATVQSAQRLRDYLSSELQEPKEKFHVRVMDVGGGFGTKGAQSYPEAALACIFSRKTKMPVKWTATRTEDMMETAMGRDEYCDVELACDKDARIVALRATAESDIGVSGTLSAMVGLTLRLMPGPYKIPNFDLKGTAYVTNKTPIGPVRGAGRPEGCYFMERVVDMMARKIGIDPIDFRRRNLIQPNEFPYDNGAGFVYDSGNFPLLLDTLIKSSNYEDLLRWKGNVNSESNGKLLGGVGVCIEVEDTGAQFAETARISLNEDGNVIIYTGSSPHGQGLETTLAQLCSQELRVPIDRITVVWGDTSLIPSGVGTFGSRSMAAGGSAVVDASRKLKSQLVAKASEILGIDPALLDFVDGRVVNRTGKGSASLTLRELVERTQSNEISASSDYRLNSLTFASGAHLCVVTLDAETGKVNIVKYVAVDDCGRVINRSIVDGQIHGGTIHGIGGSLLEQLVYDENGRLMTTNFLDYTIPSVMESPYIEVVHIETPSTVTLNGAKGVGETGTIAAYPAVINAINDAVSQIKPGTELNIAPIAPDCVFSVLRR
jgi:carbon-monoxide dehydrogenase large subunit